MRQISQHAGPGRCLVSALLACSAAMAAHAPAASRVPFDAATVASEDGRAFLISWHADRERTVQIFAGTDPRHIGFDRLVGQGTGAGQLSIANLPESPRWYFALVPDRGAPLVVADRSLHLSTAANFRDAGGYRTADGHWVRSGLIYRSNGLEHLTDGELEEIEHLGIKLVCDLRTAEEAARGPDRLPAGVAAESADVLADDADLIHAMFTGSGPPGGAAESKQALLLRIYRDFVRLPSAQRAYERLFERLADRTSLPTVFHCTAGKDRTGWAQAVLLTILGVPRSTIVADYKLTNEYLRGDALSSVRRSMAASAPISSADPAALDAAFDEVTRDYGSFENYLHSALHLDDATLAAIRSNFLIG